MTSCFRKMNSSFTMWLLITLTATSFLSLASAEDKVDKLETIVIFGTHMGEVDKAFNPKKISKETINKFQYTDVNRALKQTSGIYIREEDGQGLRPNIGLRGTNPDRSKKIVILEDDILIGPAPYSAPAAYYTPSMNQVESLEILKGFSAAHIGPNSIGGAVNYITPSISVNQTREIRLLGGSFKTLNSRLSWSEATTFGGYLIQSSYLQSDGFKKIDHYDNAGFKKADLLAKLKWNLNKNSTEHFLQFNFGYSYEDSHETYLGISEEDFNRNPFRRYASSGLDEMIFNHQKYQLLHTLQLSDFTLLKSTIYRNNFHRDWQRLDRFRGGPNLRTLLNDPSSSPAFYDVLRGDLDSASLGPNAELVVVSNDRTFYSQGVQTSLIHDHKFSSVETSSDLFLRFHQDKITRDHTSERYEMLEGRLAKTADPTQTDTSERQKSDAITVSAKTTVDYYNWSLTPLIRYEWVNFQFEDDLNPSRSTERIDNVLIPGLSVLYKWHPFFSSALSFNKAATISGITVTGNEVKEEADNYEIQFKYRDAKSFIEADVTGFYTNYQNITGTCTVSAGCTGPALDTAFNGGKANIYGLEASVAKGFLWKKLYIPIKGNLTFLNAELSSTFNSTNPEWGVGQINKGDPLPYVPKWQSSISVGFDLARFKNELVGNYQYKMFDQSVNSSERRVIPGFMVLDYAGSYLINNHTSLTYKIDNILANKYIVAARPYGLRPGKRQSFHLGVTHVF